MELVNQDIFSDQLKKNDETFRNTMERIFQKVSSFLLANASLANASLANASLANASKRKEFE